MALSGAGPALVAFDAAPVGENPEVRARRIEQRCARSLGVDVQVWPARYAQRRAGGWYALLDGAVD